MFTFLLRWLLTLDKVDIMLCTFKNGTKKYLMLTLNMFKRFLISFFIWHGITNCNAEILQGFTSNAAEILHGLMAQACKILHALTSSTAEILHGMASSDAEILQGLTSNTAEIMHASTFSAAETLHALISSTAEILHDVHSRRNSAGKDILNERKERRKERKFFSYKKRIYMCVCVKMVDSCSRENGFLCMVVRSWLYFLPDEC